MHYPLAHKKHSDKCQVFVAGLFYTSIANIYQEGSYMNTTEGEPIYNKNIMKKAPTLYWFWYLFTRKYILVSESVWRIYHPPTRINIIIPERYGNWSYTMFILMTVVFLFPDMFFLLNFSILLNKIMLRARFMLFFR